MEEKRLNVVREYLYDQFAGDSVDEKYDFDCDAQTFRVRTGRIFCY